MKEIEGWLLIVADVVVAVLLARLIYRRWVGFFERIRSRRS